jgi:hypothetical protein
LGGEYKKCCIRWRSTQKVLANHPPEPFAAEDLTGFENPSGLVFP